MQLISDRDTVLAVLHDPRFVVPPVPAAGPVGIAWLRATVGRFSSGPAHHRRRGLSVAILERIDPAQLTTPEHEHPVAVLGRAMGAPQDIVDLVREVAQAYQPGTGDETRADAAVIRLVADFGGRRDEETAARIGVLVQACEATATLIEQAREHPVEDVLRDHPPVPFTRRQAHVGVSIGAVRVEAGEIVRLNLAGLAFGAGPRRCPGREHALALVRGALA